MCHVESALSLLKKPAPEDWPVTPSREFTRRPITASSIRSHNAHLCTPTDFKHLNRMISVYPGKYPAAPKSRLVAAVRA